MKKKGTVRKSLKRIKTPENMLGFFSIKSKVIGINIESLWRRGPNANRFITNFAYTLFHENVHKAIHSTTFIKEKEDELNSRQNSQEIYDFVMGEEKIVEKMCGKAPKKLR